MLHCERQVFHFMAPARTTIKPSPMRQQLLAWFRTYAMPLAEAYEGAINLIENDRFPGRITFISHAVRDIADRLVFALDQQLKGNHVQYANYFDKIEQVWPDIQGLGDDSSPVSETVSVEINYKVAIAIDKLVQEHRLRRQSPSQYDFLFRYLMRNEPSNATINMRLVDDFKNMRGWFMSYAHFRSASVPQVNEGDLQRQFYRFERMLHSFVGDFFTVNTKLDDILRKTNQRTD